MPVHRNVYSSRLPVLAAFVLLLVLSACAAEPASPVENGDAGYGRQAILQYGCGACHTIPGIPGANTLVGPPLTDWRGRRYIAGNLINTPENLMHWIQNPQAIEPGTAMPDMNIDDQDARDIAAYLYSLGE